MRCPFGCQEAQRKLESTQRSVGYYRTKEGKIKKKALNKRRSQCHQVPQAPAEVGSQLEGLSDLDHPSSSDHLSETPPEHMSEGPANEEPVDQQSPEENLLQTSWSTVMVAYLQMLCRLIEGRRVAQAELLQMLVSLMRQHSMVRSKKIDQVISKLNQIPP